MIATAAVVGVVLTAVGLPLAIAAAISLSILWPPAAVLVIIGLAGWSLVRRRRSRRRVSEAAFLRSIAAAVSSGATPRQALLDSSGPFVDASVRRRCQIGRPMAEVAEALRPRLPQTGEELAVVLSLSEDVGARVSDALAQLAEHATAAEQLDRDRSVAVAQARFSSVVVGLVPMAAAVGVLLLRGVPEPGGAIVVIPMTVGWVLMAVGAAIVFALSSRVARA